MSYVHPDRMSWTNDERAKARYIAKRAIRLNRDPLADIESYMGMPPEEAKRCVAKAKEGLRARRHWEGAALHG